MSTLNLMRAPRSAMVEVAGDDTVSGGYPVFQIRYPDSWIAVDAAVDRSFVPTSRTFADGTFDSIQVMLRDARLVLLTHEHHDHVGGLLHSPYAAQIRQHALLTDAQVETLRDRPNKPQVRIDSATPASFITIDYDLLKPVAPGVVLLKAPGHSPGSQMVFVKLQRGQELIIAGDVAWHMDGIRLGLQKPAAVSNSLQEDRPAILAQLKWLRMVAAAGVPVLLSHDEAALDVEVQRGVIARGFDLRRSW
ncbi:MAG: MBL fold metallo-hydrolase [Longimicrobiales bacterium]